MYAIFAYVHLMKDCHGGSALIHAQYQHNSVLCATIEPYYTLNLYPAVLSVL